jgi:hypothetical protein
LAADDCLKRESLGGLDALRLRLGGRTNLAILAGSGAPCPERKLKSTPACLFGGF